MHVHADDCRRLCTESSKNLYNAVSLSALCRSRSGNVELVALD